MFLTELDQEAFVNKSWLVLSIDQNTVFGGLGTGNNRKCTNNSLSCSTTVNSKCLNSHISCSTTNTQCSNR